MSFGHSKLKRYRLAFAMSGFAFVFLGAAFFVSGNPIVTDLDGDGISERIDIDGKGKFALRVFLGEELRWEGVPVEWKPWKLLVSDVDGDGKQEMIVGVFKSTKFFPKPHNCLFIYGWDGEKGFPKWLGSSLGRPFTDFVFAELPGFKGNELVALETTREGKQSISVYFWNSFGYTRLREFGAWNSLEIKGLAGNEIELIADSKHLFLDLEKDWSDSNEKIDN